MTPVAIVLHVLEARLHLAVASAELHRAQAANRRARALLASAADELRKVRP